MKFCQVLYASVFEIKLDAPGSEMLFCFDVKSNLEVEKGNWTHKISTQKKTVNPKVGNGKYTKGGNHKKEILS